MLKQTSLYASHRAAGAKMVDFGGWEMPVSYGSQIEEHHAVRSAAGMFDVSHMLAIDLHGTGARDFLRYALANNIDKLAVEGKALYSCLLAADGGVLDDLIVYFIRDGEYRLVVNAGTADKDVLWLQALIRAYAPGLSLLPRRDLSMIAVQGPDARARFWNVLPHARASTEALKPFSSTTVGDLFVARTGYTGEDGFEVALPSQLAAGFWSQLETAGVKPCGLGARDTLRLEAGMNLYGQDMDETVSPLESGLAWTVDLVSPRDFVGKSALAQRSLQHALVGLILLDKGGVLRSHQSLTTDHGAGVITSGSFSPTLSASIALARVPIRTQVGDIATVEIRDKRLAARVVKAPFVRNGKSMLPLNC